MRLPPYPDGTNNLVEILTVGGAGGPTPLPLLLKLTLFQSQVRSGHRNLFAMLLDTGRTGSQAIGRSRTGRGLPG